MVNRTEWRENCRKGLRDFVARKVFTPADLVREIGRPEGVSSDEDSRPSRAAIYRWFETGGVGDQHIEALAEFTRSDPDVLKLSGEFVPRTPSEEHETSTAFDVYQLIVKLPERTQDVIKLLVEEMAALQYPHHVPPPRRKRTQGSLRRARR